MEITPRQLEILHTTAKLITQHGLSNLTTKAIACELNCTEPSLYRHFKSKQHILETLVNWFSENLTDSFSYALAKENGLDRLIAFFESRTDLYQRYPEIAQLSFNEELYYNGYGLSEKIRSLFIEVKKFIITSLELGQHDKSIRNDLTAEQLYYITFGGYRILLTECWFLKTRKDFKIKNDQQNDAIRKFLTEKC